MTLLIIIITVLFTIAAFNRSELMFRYNFNPYQIVHRKQWYRIFSHALLHANWEHLIINMIVLYSFGSALNRYFYIYFGSNLIPLYLGIYVGGIIISSIYTLIKEKDNFNYNAVGASGAVSAVTFACIFFDPLSKIYFMGFIPIPGIAFGALYLGYSYYMGKKNIDNVGHDAHFWGALYGFIFPLLLKPSLLSNFIDKLFH
jgi:membrane associated rhomboid family serine protease